MVRLDEVQHAVQGCGWRFTVGRMPAFGNDAGRSPGVDALQDGRDLSPGAIGVAFTLNHQYRAPDAGQMRFDVPVLERVVQPDVGPVEEKSRALAPW